MPDAWAAAAATARRVREGSQGQVAEAAVLPRPERRGPPGGGEGRGDLRAPWETTADGPGLQLKGEWTRGDGSALLLLPADEDQTGKSGVVLIRAHRLAECRNWTSEDALVPVSYNISEPTRPY